MEPSISPGPRFPHFKGTWTGSPGAAQPLASLRSVTQRVFGVPTDVLSSWAQPARRPGSATWKPGTAVGWVRVHPSLSGEPFANLATPQTLSNWPPAQRLAPRAEGREGRRQALLGLGSSPVLPLAEPRARAPSPEDLCRRWGVRSACLQDVQATAVSSPGPAAASRLAFLAPVLLIVQPQAEQANLTGSLFCLESFSHFPKLPG